MIQGIWITTDNKLMTQVYDMRNQIFHDEKRLDNSYIMPEFDENANHVIALEGDNSQEPVAYGRLRIDMNTYDFFIDNVCVLRSKRNMYYGDFIVRVLADKALRTGAKEIYVHATDDVAPFFKKIGFIQKSQDLYVLTAGHLCTKCNGGSL